jgi:hypothetical protein
MGLYNWTLLLTIRTEPSCTLPNRHQADAPGLANYNHLPLEEALGRFRRARRSLPAVPTPRGALVPREGKGRDRYRMLVNGQEEDEGEEEEMAAPASYDVQSLFLAATEGLSPADGALAGEHDHEQEQQPDLEKGVPTTASAAAVNTTGNPWFYFANHPALQVEGTPKTDKIYVAASTLQACTVCGLTSTESAATGGNIDGPGVMGCRVDDSCDASVKGKTKGEAGGVAGALEGQPEFARMWVTDRGAPLPNTTIATLYLKAVFTPGRTEGGQGDYTTVGAEQVAAALNATILALGLPTRFHLRAERAPTEANVDPAFLGPDVPEYLKEGPGEPARRRLKALRAAQRRRLQGELEGQQECGRSELFVAYVVSDWKNVTDAVARGIRSAEAEGVLTRLLQERADADAAAGLSPLAFADDAM